MVGVECVDGNVRTGRCVKAAVDAPAALLVDTPNSFAALCCRPRCGVGTTNSLLAQLSALLLVLTAGYPMVLSWSAIDVWLWGYPGSSKNPYYPVSGVHPVFNDAICLDRLNRSNGSQKKNNDAILRSRCTQSNRGTGTGLDGVQVREGVGQTSGWGLVLGKPRGASALGVPALQVLDILGELITYKA